VRTGVYDLTFGADRDADRINLIPLMLRTTYGWAKHKVFRKIHLSARRRKAGTVCVILDEGGNGLRAPRSLAYHSMAGEQILALELWGYDNHIEASPTPANLHRDLAHLPPYTTPQTI
jgi:hypothetical protein